MRTAGWLAIVTVLLVLVLGVYWWTHSGDLNVAPDAAKTIEKAKHR